MVIKFMLTFRTINSLLAYETKYYLQVYLDHYGYKIISKQITD